MHDLRGQVAVVRNDYVPGAILPVDGGRLLS